MNLSEARAFEIAGKGAREEWAEVIQFPVYLGPGRVSGGKPTDPEAGRGEDINDAATYGEQPEGLAEFLHKDATFLVGEMWGAKDRRNTQDGQWNPVTMPWGTWIETGFSRHVESKHKAGASVVLGSSIEGARKANAMDEMYALGLDIDSGAALDDVIATIRKRGLFALIYTSHSHGKSGLELKRDEVMRKLGIDTDPTLADIKTFLHDHSKSRYEESFIDAVTITDPKCQRKDGVKIVLGTPPLDKFRLIFPLADAVKLIDLAPTQDAALDLWADKITGMAQRELGIHFDSSCTDPSRLYYSARHAKGAEWDCLILWGDPLRFEDVPTMKKSDYTRTRGGAGREVERHFTESGFDLNDWYNENKERLQMADLILTHAPDKVREEKGSLIEMECPFDHEHGNAGDANDRACIAVDALDAREDRGTISCRHDSCQDRKNAAFLAEMLAQGWFTEADLYDEDAGHLLDPGEEGTDTAGRQDSTADESGEFEPVADWLPDWKYTVAGGVIMLKGRGDGDKAVPVCKSFDVVGRSSNADGSEGAGRILSFVNENGKRVEVTISRADIMGDGNAVVRMLADKGMMIVGRGKAANDRLLDLLNDITPKRQVPTVNVPGWVRDEHSDIQGFMHPTGVYDRVSGVPFRLLEGSQVEVVKPKGTLDGWTAGAEQVLTYADTNFYWPLGLVAAFGGALLGILDWDPCGFSFSGLTTKGKTLAQVLGTTVWTTPKAGKGLLFGGNSTSNAFEDQAVRGTDSFYALDEIGAMTNRAALGDVLMALSTGRTKARKAGRGLGMEKGESFRPFAILTSEHGLRNEVKATGQAYRGGLSARFPDIDVSEGIDVSEEDRARVEVVRQNYGHAGPVYVRYLQDSGIAADAAKLERTVLDIAAKLSKGKGSAMARAARPFAVAQRGGELAADAGLLGDVPAAKKAIRTAVKKAWDTFTQSDEAGAASAGEAVVDAFRSFVQSKWDRTIIPAGDIASTGEAASDADGMQARGTPLGWYDAEYIYLDWYQIEDPSKLGLDIGKRAELVKSLGEAVVWKSSGEGKRKEAPQAKLPAHVAQTADGKGRSVKNLKLLRSELGL